MGEATLHFFCTSRCYVISIDLSEVAIENLTVYCLEHGIRNIKPIKMSASEISNVGQVDFVFGSDILHHIEQFDKFVSVLRNSLRENGKAFFLENNARSKLMIWFRQNVVGKY